MSIAQTAVGSVLRPYPTADAGPAGKPRRPAPLPDGRRFRVKRRMRRAGGLLLLAAVLTATAAGAEESVEAVSPLQVVDPQRSGYAFGEPRILALQELFGFAHGILLLATACDEVPAHAEASGDAFFSWYESHEAWLDEARAELARYYYGGRAGEAAWEDVARALQLREALALAPDSAELAAACATLPAALRKPRYDLAQRFRFEGYLARLSRALETEARAAHCATVLPGDSRRILEARLGFWREINSAGEAEARAVLAAEWREDGRADSLETWLSEAGRALRVRGDLASCLAFSEGLKHPDAALRNAFRPEATPQ